DDSPVISADVPDAATFSSPTFAPALPADDLDPSDAEIAAAMNEIENGNLSSAWERMDSLHRQRIDNFSLSNDLRWFQLGVGILLEQDTVSSVETAAQWLKQLCQHEDDISRLLFARWLLHSTPAQKTELSQLLSDDSAQATTLRRWLLAI